MSVQPGMSTSQLNKLSVKVLEEYCKQKEISVSGLTKPRIIKKILDTWATDEAEDVSDDEVEVIQDDEEVEENSLTSSEDPFSKNSSLKLIPQEVVFEILIYLPVFPYYFSLQKLSQFVHSSFKHVLYPLMNEEEEPNQRRKSAFWTLKQRTNNQIHLTNMDLFNMVIPSSWVGSLSYYHCVDQVEKGTLALQSQAESKKKSAVQIRKTPARFFHMFLLQHLPYLKYIALPIGFEDMQLLAIWLEKATLCEHIILPFGFCSFPNFAFGSKLKLTSNSLKRVTFSGIPGTRKILVYSMMKRLLRMFFDGCPKLLQVDILFSDLPKSDYKTHIFSDFTYATQVRHHDFKFNVEFSYGTIPKDKEREAFDSWNFPFHAQRETESKKYTSMHDVLIQKNFDQKLEIARHYIGRFGIKPVLNPQSWIHLLSQSDKKPTFELLEAVIAAFSSKKQFMDEFTFASIIDRLSTTTPMRVSQILKSLEMLLQKGWDLSNIAISKFVYYHTGLLKLFLEQKTISLDKQSFQSMLLNAIDAKIYTTVVTLVEVFGVEKYKPFWQDFTVGANKLDLLSHVMLSKEFPDSLILLLMKTPIEVLKIRNAKKETLLHVAIHSGRLEIARYLIYNLKADSLIEVKTATGRTCLHIACLYGNVIFAQELVQHCGAKIDAEDSFKLLPIHYLLYAKHEIPISYIPNCLRPTKVNEERESEAKQLFDAAKGNISHLQQATKKRSRAETEVEDEEEPTTDTESTATTAEPISPEQKKRRKK